MTSIMLGSLPTQESAEREHKLDSRYIVMDPNVCHGKPTFRGTRIMVWQVLEMVAEGMDFDCISRQWATPIPKEAIAEAVMIAGQVFVEQAYRYSLMFEPA